MVVISLSFCVFFFFPHWGSYIQSYLFFCFKLKISFCYTWHRNEFYSRPPWSCCKICIESLKPQPWFSSSSEHSRSFISSVGHDRVGYIFLTWSRKKNKIKWKKCSSSFIVGKTEELSRQNGSDSSLNSPESRRAKYKGVRRPASMTYCQVFIGLLQFKEIQIGIE